MRPLMQPALTEPSLSLTRQVLDAQGASRRASGPAPAAPGRRTRSAALHDGPRQGRIRMPPLRTLLAVPVSVALLALAPAASSALAVPSADALLPLLVTRGGAPAAALLALDGTGSRYAEAGPGIGRAD